MAQSVKHPLGFSSGHDLTICGMESHVELQNDNVEPAWDSLSLPLCLSPAHSQLLTCVHSLSLKNK